MAFRSGFSGLNLVQNLTSLPPLKMKSCLLPSASQDVLPLLLLGSWVKENGVVEQPEIKLEVSAVNAFEALWLLYSRHIWSWFDMNCQRFPNPKTSWWIFPSWGVYILHPATVVFISYQFEEGKKKRTNQSKIHSPSPGNIRHDFLFPEVGDLNSIESIHGYATLSSGYPH